MMRLVGAGHVVVCNLGSSGMWIYTPSSMDTWGVLLPMELHRNGRCPSCIERLLVIP